MMEKLFHFAVGLFLLTLIAFVILILEGIVLTCYQMLH